MHTFNINNVKDKKKAATARMSTTSPKATAEPAKLPMINIQKESRLFAIFDEGCNCTCHTRAWAEKAEIVLEQKDKEYSELTGVTRNYKGLGSARSLGRRKIPWGVKLLSGKHFEGDVMSNELDTGDDKYMLLSLHAQCTLGFVKDTVTGKCYLKEYDDYCQLYE
eukprot:14243124-Heterocapsa_arctica.AAC.1